MSRCVIFTFIILSFFTKSSVGQSDQEKMDSLAAELSKNPGSYKKIDILMDMAEYCRAEDNLKYTLPAIKAIETALRSEKDSIVINRLLSRKAKALQYSGVYYTTSAVNDQPAAVKFYTMSLAIYRQLKMQDKVDELINYIESSYVRSGNLYMQLQTLKQALEQASANHDKIGQVRYINRLAQFYVRLDDTVNTVRYAEKGVLLEREINDSGRISQGYYLGGSLYSKIYPQKAIGYFNEALRRYRKSGNRSMIANVLIGRGETYAHLKNYQKAKSDFIEALAYADTIANNSNSDLEAYANLGKLEYDNKFTREAIKYYKLVLDRSNYRGYPGGIATTKYYLGKAYFDLGEYKLAREYAFWGLAVMKQIGSAQNIMNSERLSYSVDSALGNYKDALPHYIQFVEWREKLNSEKLEKMTMREEMNSEMEKVKTDQEKKNAEVKDQKRRQTIITFFVALVLIIVSVFLFFVFRSLKITKKQKQLIEIKEQETLKQKHLVEEKQQEMLDSINYAKRLQQAILPPEEFISSYLPDSFIVYKPKDIVAGDFYWAERCGDMFFIAVADSTGHGVPGALVSVICSTALSRAVKEFQLKETGKILDKTRDLVIETFEKSSSEIKDGMDISLLSLDLQSRAVRWSGANNPLWYFQEGELKEIKGDKQPIGATDFPRPFTTHQLPDTKKATFYLFTDGYADQFGGPKGKKFKYKQLAGLLAEWDTTKLSQQADHLNHSFETWRGTNEQVDDVTIVGFRL